MNDADSLATIAACFDLGVNHLDTAYMYGRQGESERLIARAIAGRRDDLVLATKGGLHWDAAGRQTHDARPDTLRRECEESLRRLGTDRVELYYLHAPDPAVPVAESAGAIRELIAAGKVRAAGASNATVAELEEFARPVRSASFSRPTTCSSGRSKPTWFPGAGGTVCRCWSTGRWPRACWRASSRDTTRCRRATAATSIRCFTATSGRRTTTWSTSSAGSRWKPDAPSPRWSINWTIHQPGITAALCGAKRPDQLRDNAGGLGWRLTAGQLAAIDAALAARGTPAVKNPVG